MTTVKQLYKDAIEYEESTLAHYIACLLQEGKITLDHDHSVLLEIQPDNKKLTKMIDNNQLGFCRIKIYSLKKDKNQFAFIFADSPTSAIDCYKKSFGKDPLNCHELSPDHMMHIGNRLLTFRDLKREQSKFPYLLCIYNK